MTAQILLREVNERMAASFERLALDDEKSFVCECGARGCTDRVCLTLDQYRRLRAQPGLLVAPGHGVGALVAVA